GSRYVLLPITTAWYRPSRTSPGSVPPAAGAPTDAVDPPAWGSSVKSSCARPPFLSTAATCTCAPAAGTSTSAENPPLAFSGARGPPALPARGGDLHVRPGGRHVGGGREPAVGVQRRGLAIDGDRLHELRRRDPADDLALAGAAAIDRGIAPARRDEYRVEDL